MWSPLYKKNKFSFDGHFDECKRILGYLLFVHVYQRNAGKKVLFLEQRYSAETTPQMLGEEEEVAQKNQTKIATKND